MKSRESIWLAMALAICALASAAGANIEVRGDPQYLISGPGRTVNVLVRNTGDEAAESNIHIRLYQATSSTAVLLSEAPWKTIRTLPRQSILESASVDFPTVRGETRFVIEWLDGTNQIVGKSDLLIYPTNLLKELETLAGEAHLGVFDPDHRLTPLLKQLAIETSDMEEDGVADFTGSLAIIGPFSSKAQMGAEMAARVQSLARKGKAVVWIQPPAGLRDKLQPSFYTVRVGAGAVVVAQAETVAGLADDPRAQLRLLRLARLALHPETPALPAQVNPEP